MNTPAQAELGRGTLERNLRLNRGDAPGTLFLLTFPPNRRRIWLL